MNESHTPEAKVGATRIYRNRLVAFFTMLVGGSAFALFLISILSRCGHQSGRAEIFCGGEIAQLALTAGWTVGVPAWFYFEHVYLFPKFGNHDQYDRFKRGQDLASKVWVGCIVVLAAVLAGDI